MSNVILIRYGEPSKYDHGPYGAICKVIKATVKDYDVYVQYGPNEEEPQWQLIGSFDDENDNDLINKVELMIKK